MTATLSLAETHSIFEQPWWLEATAPGTWDAVELEEGGRMIARLPFVAKRVRGMRVLTQPPLTQTLGPWHDHLEAPESRRLAREKDVFRRLIERLPRHDAFRQSFHPHVTNWQPFYWAGFEQTTYYTYTIDDLTAPDQLLASMSKTTRQLIRDADNLITVIPGTIDDLARLAEKTFARQSLALPYSRELLHRIDEAASAHAHRRILIGVDPEGRHHAGAFIVGDHRRAYLLVSGADPDLRRSGAGAYVHWRAIQEAAAFTEVFDFEGSMLPGVEEFYRKLGGRQTPYSAVSSSSRLVRAATAVRALLR